MTILTNQYFWLGILCAAFFYLPAYELGKVMGLRMANKLLDAQIKVRRGY